MASRKATRHATIGPGRWQWARSIGRFVARMVRRIPVVLFFWWFGELVLVLLADVARALLSNHGNRVPGLLAQAMLAGIATAILGFRRLASAVARSARRAMLGPHPTGRPPMRSAWQAQHARGTNPGPNGPGTTLSGRRDGDCWWAGRSASIDERRSSDRARLPTARRQPRR
jgi:hypothetical protein